MKEERKWCGCEGETKPVAKSSAEEEVNTQRWHARTVDLQAGIGEEMSKIIGKWSETPE